MKLRRMLSITLMFLMVAAVSLSANASSMYIQHSAPNIAFTYNLNGRTGQLAIIVLDADGNVFSSTQTGMRGNIVVPPDMTMLIGTPESGGMDEIYLTAGQAGTLTINTSTPAKFDMGYQQHGFGKTYTYFASQPTTVTSATIRVPNTAYYYFVARNIGVTSVTITSASLT